MKWVEERRGLSQRGLVSPLNILGIVVLAWCFVPIVGNNPAVLCGCITPCYTVASLKGCHIKMSTGRTFCYHKHLVGGKKKEKSCTFICLYGFGTLFCYMCGNKELNWVFRGLRSHPVPTIFFSTTGASYCRGWLGRIYCNIWWGKLLL